MNKNGLTEEIRRLETICQKKLEGLISGANNGLTMYFAIDDAKRCLKRLIGEVVRGKYINSGDKDGMIRRLSRIMKKLDIKFEDEKVNRCGHHRRAKRCRGLGCGCDDRLLQGGEPSEGGR